MVLQGDTLYAINDGDNAPTLYLCDTMGNILRKWPVRSTNHDWEELTPGKDGTLYIGDFGNNDNRRTNLQILCLRINESTSDTLEVDTIRFEYEDQVSYPPAASQMKFDAEAMVWMRDSLHLFTKNRTSPYNGWIFHYVLPDQPGHAIARLVDSFYTGGTFKELYWVTGAALSKDLRQLALISSDKVYLFSGFSGSQFFSAQFKTLPLGDISQKEAIAFENDYTLWISDEFNSLRAAGLYRLSLTTASGRSTPPKSPPRVIYHPDRLSISFQSTAPLGTIIVRDASGRLVQQLEINTPEYELDVSNWSSGHYLCEVIKENQPYFCVIKKF